MRRNVALLAFLLAVTGCAGHSAARPAANPGTTAPAAPVSIQLILPSRTVMAGSRLAAHVVVHNNTGHAIRRPGCGALFTVALASSSYHPVVATPSCLQILTIPAGTSRYRVQVLASYLACSMRHASGGLKACLPGLKAPPLPSGNYYAKLFFQVRQFAPAPPLVPVLVMPAARLR
ncbi:MAG TPA: hypothetical protein VMA72_14555 [Streptosporangiaceae bacterium]|nr:hypothetical protein [Streptosporangiaceae bacterium]